MWVCCRRLRCCWPTCAKIYTLLYLNSSTARLHCADWLTTSCYGGGRCVFCTLSELAPVQTEKEGKGGRGGCSAMFRSAVVCFARRRFFFFRLVARKQMTTQYKTNLSSRKWLGGPKKRKKKEKYETKSSPVGGRSVGRFFFRLFFFIFKLLCFFTAHSSSSASAPYHLYHTADPLWQQQLSLSAFSLPRTVKTKQIP